MKKRKPRAIVLTKAACRPIMKAAFERGCLQVQKEGVDNGCYYSSPCVIGACLTSRQRVRLDDAGKLYVGIEDTTIADLINGGVIETDDDEWFMRRQEAHDSGDVKLLRQLLGARNPRP